MLRSAPPGASITKEERHDERGRHDRGATEEQRRPSGRVTQRLQEPAGRAFHDGYEPVGELGPDPGDARIR